ncbi:hypothetical protein L6452_33309 [Arctium lappa]|uniref:Uncharacterized protein n=1 Tax=Arctium lappa TaxID=4217 RepID=A0ACB8Z885_ARCLA|nr:hypothetical protein L6452_33309 [Arctium lappa]
MNGLISIFVIFVSSISYLHYGLLAARAEILGTSKDSENPCVMAGYHAVLGGKPHVSPWGLRFRVEPSILKMLACGLSLVILNSNNVVVNRLSSVNSQMFHIVVNGCRNVRMVGVNVVAPWNILNTDGIHVQLSTGVIILNSKLSTNDDCVSVGPGATNLSIENVACGPDHGIREGLKRSRSANVTVKRVTFKGTQNGSRIKSWARPSSGFVDGVLEENAIMTDVHNPIVID